MEHTIEWELVIETTYRMRLPKEDFATYDDAMDYAWEYYVDLVGNERIVRETTKELD